MDSHMLDEIKEQIELCFMCARMDAADSGILKDSLNYKTAVPVGFDERDVVMEAPPLFDDLFHIMFFRQMMKLNFGYSAVNSAMSYSKEVQDIYRLNYDIANKYYVMTTNYLLAKGMLGKTTYVTMPN